MSFLRSCLKPECTDPQIQALMDLQKNIVRTLRIENKQCYIMGDDFNIDLLNYDHHMETHES